MYRTTIIRSMVGGAVAAALVIALATSSVLATSGATPILARQASRDVVQTAATCSPGASSCPIRITFADGAYSGQAHGHLNGIHSQQWFVVKAKAGQTMVVVVKGAGATRGIVTFPSGKTVGQPGGRVFDGVLPASGDYRIQVTESPMGEGWSGGIDVIVLIY
jgi:hypothetical protein